MQLQREVVAEYDYSVRVNLASSAICGGVRTPSVTLKLHLQSEGSSGSEQRQVMLELTPEQLAELLDTFAAISKELTRRP